MTDTMYYVADYITTILLNPQNNFLIIVQYSFDLCLHLDGNQL